MATKPVDWPGTDEEWDEYQEMLEEDKPKADDKIVAAIERLAAAVAAIPNSASGYDVLAKRIEGLTTALLANVPKAVMPAKKWTFTVNRDTMIFIVAH